MCKPVNFAVDVNGAGGIERALKRFKRESSPLLAEVKRRARFSPKGEARKKKIAQNRKKKNRGIFRRYHGFRPSKMENTTSPAPPGPETPRIPETPSTKTASFPFGDVTSENPEGAKTIPITSSPVLTSSVVPVVEQKAVKVAVEMPISNGKVSEAALIIVKFLSNPPTFAMIKDLGKRFFGFPFGGREKIDKDIFATAERECKEEIFYEIDLKALGIEFSITAKNFVGTIRPASNHIIYVFYVELPANTPIRPGIEQFDYEKKEGGEVKIGGAWKVSLEKIEGFIKRGIFLTNHTAALNLVKKFLNSK